MPCRPRRRHRGPAHLGANGRDADPWRPSTRPVVAVTETTADLRAGAQSPTLAAIPLRDSGRRASDPDRLEAAAALYRRRRRDDRQLRLPDRGRADAADEGEVDGATVRASTPATSGCASCACRSARRTSPRRASPTPTTIWRRAHTDPRLRHFSIVHDRAYILPALRSASELNRQLYVEGVPWTAPAWMKANDQLDNLGDGGALQRRDDAPFARYLVRFVRAYDATACTSTRSPLPTSPSPRPAIPGCTCRRRSRPGSCADSCDRRCAAPSSARRCSAGI